MDGLKTLVRTKQIRVCLLNIGTLTKKTEEFAIWSGAKSYDIERERGKNGYKYLHFGATTAGASRPDKEGYLISNRMNIMERWVEYFDELLNNQNIGELEVPLTEDNGQMLPPRSIEETVRAIHRLKNHKSSPGADGITTKLVKYGGDQLHQAVDQLMHKD